MYKYVSLVRRKIEACIMYVLYIIFCFFIIPIIYIYTLFSTFSEYSHQSLLSFITDCCIILLFLKKKKIKPIALPYKNSATQTPKKTIYILYSKTWTDVAALLIFMKKHTFKLDITESSYFTKNITFNIICKLLMKAQSKIKNTPTKIVATIHNNKSNTFTCKAHQNICVYKVQTHEKITPEESEISFTFTDINSL